MTYEEREALVRGVGAQIAILLSDLERRTGCYVEGLGIRDTDVSALICSAPEYMRCVEIDLRRPPGSQWTTR